MALKVLIDMWCKTKWDDRFCEASPLNSLMGLFPLLGGYYEKYKKQLQTSLKPSPVASFWESKALCVFAYNC